MHNHRKCPNYLYYIDSLLKHQVKRMYDLYKVNKLYSHRLHCKAIIFAVANLPPCQCYPFHWLTPLLGLRPESNNMHSMDL